MTGGADLAAAKSEARRAAMARRKQAFEALGPDCSAVLAGVLAAHAGRVLAGYMPMRTEISPLGAMAAMAERGPVCVPVIEGRDLPLRFARWVPGCAMVEGAFGAQVPAVPEWLVPEVLIVPLLAFDRRGGRLGYGGGFYDRTLEALRARGPVLAIGFAYGAQEAEALPLEPVDQPLDLLVTEAEVMSFGAGG